MNLYEIPREVDEAFALYLSSFDQETGEQIATDEETGARFQALKEMENKKNDIVQWALSKRANAIADVTAVESEIERLQKLAQSAQKTADKMEDMLGVFLPPTELTEMTQFGNWKIGYRKSEAVKIDDEAKLPQEFIKIPEPKPSPDKTAIKEALKNGTVVPGASLEVRNNLQIK